MNRERASMQKSAIVAQGIGLLLSKRKPAEFYDSVTDSDTDAENLRYHEKEAVNG